MPIPDTDRVIYRKAVLEEVICQLRFPTILKITSESPAQFQESIREQYPIFEEKYSSPPANLPPELLSFIERSTSSSHRRAYDFVTDDKFWKVGLTDNFLALSTSNYERWERFREMLEPAIDALLTTYRPSFFDRVGLRYKDVIIRSNLGLSEVNWASLLQPHISGPLGLSEISDEVTSSQHEFLLNLGSNVGSAKVKHYLATVKDTDERCYVIDADFFYEARTEAEHVVTKLNELNSYAGKLFRWCITEQLYEAMEPDPINRD